MIRIACLAAAAVLAAAVAPVVHADPIAPTLTVVSRHQSRRKNSVVVRSGKVARTPAGITLTLRGSGALCNADWTLDGDVIHGVTNVDAPAMPSCTIVLAVSPWPEDKRSIGLVVDAAAARTFTVPVR